MGLGVQMGSIGPGRQGEGWAGGGPELFPGWPVTFIASQATRLFPSAAVALPAWVVPSCRQQEPGVGGDGAKGLLGEGTGGAG